MSATTSTRNDPGRVQSQGPHSATILLHSPSCRPESADDSRGSYAIEGNAQYPWPSNAEPIATADTNVPLASHYIYRPVQPIYEDLWEELCPPSTLDLYSKETQDSTSPTELQVSGTWTPDESPNEVAENLLGQCGSTLMTDQSIGLLAASLSESLQAYRDFCQKHVIPARKQQVQEDGCCVHFKYRLIATRGESGTKCPLYHFDHVPVRWIQTFVGPGVDMVVGNDGVRWEAFQSYERDEDDHELSLTDEERNDFRVDASVANVYSAPPGEAVLMIGNEFNGNQQDISALSSRVRPVVHKSPQMPQGRPRVRFTQDIVFH